MGALAITQNMRVGIVGGQKRKTETHLFNSLRKMNVDVAWHIEAMTSKECKADVFAIVCIIDYCGHRLYWQAKDFAFANKIEFRTVSFNWAKSVAIFVKLQEQYNKLKEKEMPKYNITDPNLATAHEIGKLVKKDGKTIIWHADQGNISHQTISIDGKNVRLFNKEECVKFFAERDMIGKQPIHVFADALKDDDQMNLPTEITSTRSVEERAEEIVKEAEVLAKELDKKTITEFDLEKETFVATDKIHKSQLNKTFGQKTTINHNEPIKTQIPFVSGFSITDTKEHKNTEPKQKLVLCKITESISGLGVLNYIPIIEIDSMDDIEDAVLLELTKGSGNYAVITVVKHFKAKIKLEITDL